MNEYTYTHDIDTKMTWISSSVLTI